MIKAVIFDMDGVISDTQRLHASVEEQILKERGIEMSAEEITKRFAGVSGREMFKNVFADFGKAAHDVDRIVEEKWRRMITLAKGNIDEIPGTKEFIERLKDHNVRLGVASASRHEFIELVLSELDLKERFHAITSAEEVEKGKPDPAIFLLAAKKLSVESVECAVIEDGVSGMIAAKRAGMACVGLVRHPYERRESYPADFIVKDLRDVSTEMLNL